MKSLLLMYPPKSQRFLESSSSRSFAHKESVLLLQFRSAGEASGIRRWRLALRHDQTEHKTESLSLCRRESCDFDESFGGFVCGSVAGIQSEGMMRTRWRSKSTLSRHGFASNHRKSKPFSVLFPPWLISANALCSDLFALWGTTITRLGKNTVVLGYW